ncbi:hypothetical protein [Adhaeribacter aquaticus]|uniref:hypothetical protein n=1 Tax=Adhaeribacter aquaticus TaxID=299567 RepID=UPI0003FF3D62|nr:hypothetical protein [Adhaeribacter aquaticus]
MRADSNGPKNNFQSILKYFSLVMALVYPAIGVYLFFSTPEQIALPAKTKMAIGAVLFLYGIFRFIRTYKRHAEQKDETFKD